MFSMMLEVLLFSSILYLLVIPCIETVEAASLVKTGLEFCIE